MSQRVLLITPPFTQPNTPYPATAYLKGFFNEQGIDSSQLDLSLETILALFSGDQLFKLFQKAESSQELFSENEAFIFAHRQAYLNTIDPVINFLQNRNPTSAHLICSRNYLPEASRFNNLDDVDWAFGNMGIQDKAKHLATLYLEDLGDFIKSIIDPHFGFSRYAERLATSLSDFGPMDEALCGVGTFINDIYLGLLSACIVSRQPSLICLTVPFPGNLFAALKCGQFVKANFPEMKVALGGGYCNTELRNIVDERLFKYIDFLCLDDGEAPLLCLTEYLSGERSVSALKRTFRLHGGVIGYLNGAQEKDIPQRQVGTPDYGDLPVDRYLSMIEVPNPMHRLWSDGFWNKLTLAHGCYWGKCTFCDISLDYIARYEPIDAALICDRIVEIIKQTGRTGFHFVDEAAPPALMRDLALELITRQVQINWWTNIRFEKRFTPDLCRLLHASGCIAISGGLEVASDRLLSLIQKGVTVEQVATVTHAFTQAGIMVHAYLMYGFPTQTEQETIDALEMVRQMFDLDIIQSGFWHRFAMTAHSPVGINPAAFEVEVAGPGFGGFAHNDLQHIDPDGADHRLYSEGLRKSLFNYMQGIGLEHPIPDWFDFTVPDPTVAPDHIAQILAKEMATMRYRDDAVLIWLGGEVLCFILDEVNDRIIACEVAINDGSVVVPIDAGVADWLHRFLASIAQSNYSRTSFAELKADFERSTSLAFSELLASDGWAVLRNHGLLIV